MLVTDAQSLWTTGAEALRGQVSDATWKTWFEGITPVEATDRTLVLAVPNTLVKERIEGRYLELVRDVVADASSRQLEIAIVVRTEPAPPASMPEERVSTANGLPATPGRPPGRDPGEGGYLDARYTFDAFVIGSSNRFAHAAALSVAESPGRSYNPLFIHGGSGLGKTHLLQAIGHYVRENFPARHVRYVTTESFLNEYVDMIRTNTGPAFRRRYRECDVLLVDDVQLLEGREGLQEEFFHTFSHLYGAQKQIVLTCDRPPRSLATLEDRLRTRFLSGLTTDVQPPEIETRLAILRKKAEGESIHVPHEVMEFIATHIKDNIRELEGAMIRVTAYASLNREPMTLDLAETVLADLAGANMPRQITPEIILNATSTAFGFSIEELKGPNRRRPLVNARQVGMYVFRELTDFSYPAIGREFGNRDHTTVIHAVEKITGQMKERRQIFDQVSQLITTIKAGG